MQIGKELWLKIGDGDQQAYAQVYRFYYKRFYNYGKKFTNDEALLEDAVQETLLQVWEKRKKLSAIAYSASYFYTSFRFILFGKLKLQKRLVANLSEEGEPEFSADQVIVAKETDADIKAQLQKALATLTARQREAVFLRFYEGLSYEEVAAVLNITTKATYKIMARALSQLKQGVAFSCGLFLLLPSLFSSSGPFQK